MRHELNQQIQQVLTELPGDDLDMILLRHVEELSNKEVAELLGLEVKTASKRYGRAPLKCLNGSRG